MVLHGTWPNGPYRFGTRGPAMTHLFVLMGRGAFGKGRECGLEISLHQHRCRLMPLGRRSESNDAQNPLATG